MKGSSALSFRGLKRDDIVGKKILNDRNGRRQLQVSSLLLLPQVATAKRLDGLSLLGSELGSLLRHGNPYCTLRPLPSLTTIRL